MIRKRTGLFLFGFLCIAASIVLAVYLVIAPKFKYKAPQTQIATAFQTHKKIFPFKLQSTNGDAFTDASFRGQWTLIFFGYTKCPDICPRTLGVIRESWDMFESSKQPVPVRFVFADISPETVPGAELKQFLQNYNPDFIGVNGTSEQMRKLSDQLGIYSKQQEQNIDHSASLMLIDPQGKLCAVFNPPFTAAQVVHDLTVLTL